jgi:uncharacterized oxidoreductase
MTSLAGESVLVTGGSEGIGLGLARRFLERGAKVLVTGRSQTKLEAATRALPGLLGFMNDVGVAREREALATHVRSVLPGLTWIVNNAGIQRRIALAADDAPWDERQREIDILFAAPVHLNHLLVPLLLEQGRATTIVNVTSGGAYVPQVFAPVYSACKAALHAYTVTLRDALSKTRCRVVELAPPAVQTALSTPAHGAPLDTFCDAVFEALVNSTATTIGYGPTADIDARSRSELDALFVQSAQRAGVRRY